MAIDEQLPPACAFAIAVLLERDQDPDAVPEEAVEAAQLHLKTCLRCTSTPPAIAAPRKKRKTRKAMAGVAEPAGGGNTSTLQMALPTTPIPETQSILMGEAAANTQMPGGAIGEGFDCAQCRQVLPEYAEAIESGENVALLYPDVQEHLQTCGSGCLVLLDLLRQEAKANRKRNRRPVRDPFRAIAWELSGFFRGGQITMAPMALAYGTLILLLLVGLLSVYFTIRWDDARHAPPAAVAGLPTPDGVGISDGRAIYDACNTVGYQDKRAAAQALQRGDATQASGLLTAAINAVNADTSGCNGAEAAIYRADLQVRQAGRPFGVVVVAFDSGPGNADPHGGSDRHTLYAAETQELVGAYIAQQEYNRAEMNIAEAPLLYLVLANTTGSTQGALQIANSAARLATTTELQTMGLLATGQAPLLGVLGMAPGNEMQEALPVLCQAGIPLLTPTATSLFLIDQLQHGQIYQHCAAGFAFIRTSPDDEQQSALAASYAYGQLRARKAAIFYDPADPVSVGEEQAFSYHFPRNSGAVISAEETVVPSNLLDSNGRSLVPADLLQTEVNDALAGGARPDVIFAPLLTDDVIALAQRIAKLPANQQPMLLIGNTFSHPAALQRLAQWARQQQLNLPRIYIVQAAAARPPASSSDNGWQKQFYASFCTSFATPGGFCSGAGALDQGALLFADNIELLAKALGANHDPTQVSSAAQLVKQMGGQRFLGVSGAIALRSWGKVFLTPVVAAPVMLSMQQDGSLQVVG